MRALLWKEYREKRVWLLLLLASTVGVVLRGYGYTYAGGNATPWATISTLIALLLGAATFSSEIAGRNANFLFSRPVSWKKLLLSKVIIGIGLLLLTAVITAIVYRLICPEPYKHLATPYSLGKGVLYAMMFMGFGYFFGLVCSAVLPGAFGGLLVAFAGCIALSVCEGALYSPSAYYHVKSEWSPWAWAIGALIAMILISRFGLTLTNGARIWRFVLTILVTVLCFLPLDFLAEKDPADMLARLFKPSYGSVSIGPSGKYLLADIRHRQYLIRLSDSKRGISRVNPENALWASLDTAYSLNGSEIKIAWMRPNGKVEYNRIPLGQLAQAAIPSPSGRFTIVRQLSNKSGGDSQPSPGLMAVDILNPSIVLDIEKGIRDFWWQSATEVGYVDDQGNRHIVTLK